MASAMHDPSDGIPGQLLPHIHLLLNQQFPGVPPKPGGLEVDKVVQILLEAVQQSKTEKTVSWQVLRGPPNGSIFVAWQPPKLEKRFASDGYLYAGEERAFQTKVSGYVSVTGTAFGV